MALVVASIVPKVRIQAAFVISAYFEAQRCYNKSMNVTTSTHTSLLARLADSADPFAWRDFQERYGELLHGFARRRGLQPADCDDAVQDVLLALSRAMPGFQYDPAKGKFRAYLKAVAVRTILKRVRQNEGPRGLEDIEQVARAAVMDPAFEEAWEVEWRRYHLRTALRAVASEFGPEARQAFERYAINGEDSGATAAALGITINQVYQAKSRIMRRLAEIVESQINEEG
jgi:RNA polymerase sigma factor (sigma-70 family)